MTTRRFSWVKVALMSLTFITNKVTSVLDLQTIRNYVKSTNCINANDLKLLGFPNLSSI